MNNFYTDLLDSYSKLKKRQLVLEDNEEAIVADAEKYAALQAAEATALGFINTVTDDWMPVGNVQGLEMKRSSAKVAVNKSVVVKGLGHAWSHGIKVVDENGQPIGSIDDLRSPWGRFVAKLVPEIDAEMNNKEVSGDEPQVDEGIPEELLTPEEKEIEASERAIGEVKNIICQSVEYLESFFHRLKNKHKNYSDKQWSSKDKIEDRSRGQEYDFKHMSSQICDDTPEALSTRFREIRGMVVQGSFKSLKEDFAIPADDALFYATNYLDLIERTKTSGYLDSEDSVFTISENFSVIEGDSPENSFVVFKGEDGISGAVISQASSPMLYDIVDMIHGEIADKYKDDNIIKGIPRLSPDKINYRFKTLGTDMEKISRLMSLMSHSRTNMAAGEAITNTLLEIMNSSGGEIIEGLNNIVRYSLTDVDKMSNVDHAYSLRDAFGYVDGMDDESLKEFILSADRQVAIQWSADQAKEWIKKMLHAITTINSKSNMMRRPIGVSEVGTNIFLGSKADVIEYYPNNFAETILMNQGVPPDKIQRFVKLEQTTGRVGNEKAGTAIDSSEMFGLMDSSYDSVNFSLKTLFSPKEKNISLGGFKYNTSLNGLATYLGHRTGAGGNQRQAMAIDGITQSYATGTSLNESSIKSVAQDVYTRMSDVEKIFSVGLGKFIDKDGINLEKEQKTYIMDLIDDFIDRDIFESSVSYKLRQIKTDPSKELRPKEMVEIAGALLVQKMKYDMFQPNKGRFEIQTDQDMRDHQKKMLHSVGLMMQMNGGCSEETLMQVTDLPNNDVYLVSQNDLIHNAINQLSQMIDSGEDIQYKPGSMTIGGYSLEFTKDNKINLKGPGLGPTATNRPLNYMSLYYKNKNFNNLTDTTQSLTMQVEANRLYVAEQNYYKQVHPQESSMMGESIKELFEKQNEVISKLLESLAKKEGIV
jgi:hypothetical protein